MKNSSEGSYSTGGLFRLMSRALLAQRARQENRGDGLLQKFLEPPAARGSAESL